MTKKEKIINMFRDENGWKTGIRNGLTILQIMDKLGIKPQSHAELWDEKRKVISFVNWLMKSLHKEKVPFYGLPFSRRQTRIYFIIETKEEARRCQNYLENHHNQIVRKTRYEQQKIREAIRREIADPRCSKKRKKEFQALLDECYESIGD